MKLSIIKLTATALGLVAPLLVANAAFASATCRVSDGTVVVINDIDSCGFEFSGGCTERCVPLSYTATCSEECTATETTTCTNTCETKCQTECVKQPDTFTCQDYCNTDCEAGCMASCDGSGCAASCSASCETTCTERCQRHPGATTCATECQDSCSATCTVKENISCELECSSRLTGGCTASCSSVQGGLFCDGQFIDITAVTDCSFSLEISASGSISSSCAAAPGSDAPFGLAMIGGVAGLALIATRRRKSQPRA